MKIIILTKHPTLEYETARLVTKFIEGNHSVQVCQFSEFAVVINDTLKYQGEDIDMPDVVLVRYGAGITSAELSVIRYFELRGIRCVNTSTSVDIVQNKFYASQLLNNANIAVPATMLVKFPVDINLIKTHIGFPCIIKVITGSFGEGVYMVHTDIEYLKFVEFLKNIDNDKLLLAQEYLGDNPGVDLRVFVIGDKVIGAMKRVAPKDDFRANITIGGTGESYPVTNEITEIALSTAKALGLEIAGIDLLFDHRGFRVCEANSNPGFKGFDQYCKVDIAEHIFQYITHLK